MKKLLAIMGMSLLFVSLAACGTVEAYEAYVTVDINPSIGFVVNEQAMVKTAYALNEDGEMLMLQLNLAEKTVEAAMGEVIDKAMDLGFIDVDAAETIIEVDAVGNTDKITEQVRSMVMEQLESNMSERALQTQVRQRQYDSEFQTQAENKGLDPATYRLMQNALNIDPELTEEDALTEDPEGLINRIRTNNQVVAGVAQSLVDEFKVAKDAILDEYQPLIQALRDQITAATEAEEPTETLEADLLALQTEMRVELQAVVASYIAQSEPLMTAIQTACQTRIQEHAEEVANYRNQLQINKNSSGTTSGTTSNTAATSGSGNTNS